MFFPYTAFDVLYHRLTEYRLQGAIGAMWMRASRTPVFEWVAFPEADMAGLHGKIERMIENLGPTGRAFTQLTFVFDRWSLLVAFCDPFELGVVVRRREALPYLERLAVAFLNGEIARALQKPQAPLLIPQPLEIMPTPSLTPELVPSLTAVKELGFTSQPAELWTQFRRRFEGILSQELGALQAAQLIESHERRLVKRTPEPWVYLPFAHHVLESLPNSLSRDRMTERVKNLVADLLAAS